VEHKPKPLIAGV